MREYLKVKLLSLIAETDIIRDREELYKSLIEQREWDGFPAGTERKILAGLVSHRMGVVRPEIRATHIAYGALKGKDLEEIEAYPSKIPEKILRKAARMFTKYGEYDLQDGVDRFATWVISAIYYETAVDAFLLGDINKEQIEKTINVLRALRDDPKSIYKR